LSEHRRRSPGKRRAPRRNGVLLPTAATAVTAVAGIAIAGYLVAFRPGNAPNSGAAIAAAAVSGSRAMAVLEQQRQQMIVMSAASHTMRIIGAPKIAAQPTQAAGGSSAGASGAAGGVPVAPPDPGTAQRIAYNMLSSFGWSPGTYFSCLDNIWTRESGWRYNAQNASGAYGIPQALPGSKMATAGADWMTNPATQIKWGLGYIQGRYGDPCSAWSYWQAHGYY
jgi:resuscitation-promoting factor RpfB